MSPWPRANSGTPPKADPGEVCYVLAVSYGPPLLGGLYGLIERLSR